MALFPFPMGGVSFEEKDRYERATRLVRSMAGEGGYSDDDDAAVNRTFSVYGLLAAGVSLATSRMIENIYPHRSDPLDLLPRHEEFLNSPSSAGDTVEDRWARLHRIWATSGGGKLTDIAREIFLEIGVFPGAQYNLAAELDGYTPPQPRQFMFAVAFELPVAYIKTRGQVAKLMAIVNKYKPSTVGAAVTRTVADGFRLDDPNSLLDRDVFAKGQ